VQWADARDSRARVSSESRARLIARESNLIEHQRRAIRLHEFRG
jgi:hypothetical protein